MPISGLLQPSNFRCRTNLHPEADGDGGGLSAAPCGVALTENGTSVPDHDYCTDLEERCSANVGRAANLAS